MRKLLSWLGRVTMLLLVVIGATLAYMAREGSRVDREARIYADQSIQSVVQDWNAQALKDRASPGLLASIKPDQLTSLFRWFATLGKLKSVDPCSGQSILNISTASGRTLNAQYTCEAAFQAGRATIHVSLLKGQAGWMVSGFHVTSSALVPQAQDRKI